MKFGSLDSAAALRPLLCRCRCCTSISFSSSRIRSCLAQSRAAWRSLSLMAVAIGLGFFEPPEIEAADAIGLERFAKIDAALSTASCCLKSKSAWNWSRRGPSFDMRRARPMHFEERAGDIGDAQLVFAQDLRAHDRLHSASRSRDVLSPHAANLDPVQAEIVCGHRAGVIEILRRFRR